MAAGIVRWNAPRKARRLGLTQIQVAGHFVPVMIGSAEA